MIYSEVVRLLQIRCCVIKNQAVKRERCASVRVCQQLAAVLTMKRSPAAAIIATAAITDDADSSSLTLEDQQHGEGGETERWMEHPRASVGCLTFLPGIYPCSTISGAHSTHWVVPGRTAAPKNLARRNFLST